MSQCITCYRCVRICDEVQGQFVWQVLDRGAQTRIVPDSGTTLDESSCVVAARAWTPVRRGALEDKTVLDRGHTDEHGRRPPVRTAAPAAR